MQMKDITEEDGKNIIQLHKILNLATREMKFSIEDAKVVDESLKWFAKFATMAGQIQQFEREKAAKEAPREGTPAGDGLVIKDYNPGDLTVVSGGKSKSKSKSKAKSKTKAKTKGRRK